MIRMRIYESQGSDHDSADRVFYELVKPVHERHGARFLGRYRDQEGRVVVMWLYENEAACSAIQRTVAEDPVTIENAIFRRQAGLHGLKFTEYFLDSTD
ncbi:MAG: hypothetical protein GY768_23180 [Planctomycetaceae bacterium]|nr:hypothetical protein [Planctomycetaceae bacterium]